MSKPAKILQILPLILVLGCALLLSACWGGSSGNNKSAVITAHADLPSSAYANGKFMAGVSLTSSNASKGTASVKLVDVGTVTPQIDCGQPQTLTIGGNGGSFTCQTPAVNLGASNTHQLQVDVNGKPNLATPVPVEVVNGGRVKARLTNAAGAAIKVAGTGQTFYVSFKSTPGRVPAGRYTVTAPSGWSVGDNGVCNVSVESPSCRVPVTVAANAKPDFYGLELNATEGSSPLSPFLLPIIVSANPVGTNQSEHSLAPAQRASTDGCVTLSHGQDFSECYSPLPAYTSQNISETLYEGIDPTTGRGFKYKPVFFFQNNSSKPLTITSVIVTGLTVNNSQGEGGYGCDVQPLASAKYSLTASEKCTLQPKELYAVSGLLGATETASSRKTLSIGITINSGSEVIQNFQTQVTFVPYLKNHVAVRVVTPAETDIAPAPVYAGAYYGSFMVKFTPSKSHPSVTYAGTISTAPANGAFKENQIELTKTYSGGGLFYLPQGASGDVLFTQQRGGFQSSDVPSVSARLKAPSFLLLELTYPAGQQAYIDQSYVNSIGVMATFNVMGDTSPRHLYTENTVHGVGDLFFNLKNEQQIFQAMKKQFDQFGTKTNPGPWRYVKAHGSKNYIRETKNGTITNILAPIAVDGVNISKNGKNHPLDPMPKDYYDNYVKALWSYLEKNPIYVSADTVVPGIGYPTPSHCVLKGVVLPAASTSPNAGKLVFSTYSGTCPAVSITNAQGTSQNTPDLVFAPFNKCDFLKAASPGCHPNTLHEGLYGSGGSYQGEIGKIIVSYQAVGLLPVCGDPSQVMSQNQARMDLNDPKHYLPFQNPSCLSTTAYSASQKVWNVYARILNAYANVYSYSYGDFLGLSGTVVFHPNKLKNSNPTLYHDLNGVLQPITMTMLAPPVATLGVPAIFR